MAIDRNHLDIISAILKQHRNFDIGGYRIESIKRGINHRIKQTGVQELHGYIELLGESRRERDFLINSIAVGYSKFFRNPMVFDIIEERLLPEIINRKRNLSKREIRTWSAGCANGEEPYSLAILLHLTTKADSHWNCGIFATDIDKSAIARAKAGAYRRESLENVRLGVLDEYFRPHGDIYRIEPFIEKMVSFSCNDLTSEKSLFPPDSIFGDFDLLLCRNVLIYFNTDLQGAVMQKLTRALALGGFLVLGDSESPGANAQYLETVDFQHRIYRKRESTYQ